MNLLLLTEKFEESNRLCDLLGKSHNREITGTTGPKF